MVIKYYDSISGKEILIDVNEEVAIGIEESYRKESNQDRKERRHCFSYDAFEDISKADILADEDDIPIDRLIESMENSKIHYAFSQLNETQQRRLLKFADGMSMREIARQEGVDHKAVSKSIEQARKKFKKFF